MSEAPENYTTKCIRFEDSKPDWPMTEAQQRAYDQAQVMIAFAQGKKIECRFRDTDDPWVPTLGEHPSWLYDTTDYRIAPEPQEVWLWVKQGSYPIPYDHGDALSYSGMITKGYTKKLFREVLP